MTTSTALYQRLVNRNGDVTAIMRLSDRMTLPLDGGGLDWLAYLEYVQAGGVVLEADGQSETERLAVAKQNKLAEVAQAAQTFIDTAVQDAAPRVERDTYPLQAAEAENWALDNSIATPLLEGIAAARNIDLNELRQRTLDKSRAWTKLCADIIGQRQAYEDQINTTQTIEALDIIQVTYRVTMSL